MASHRKAVRLSVIFALLAGLILVFSSGLRAQAQDGPDKIDEETARREFFARIEADILAGAAGPAMPAMAATPCEDGFAGPYPCENVDLLAFMPLATIGGGTGNDVWGWTDPLDGKEYAIMARSNGSAFVDISDPENPVYLGNLPTQTSSSTWRDIKVYSDHAFIVSEASGHGMQVFDLTRLRNVVNPPVTFTVDAHYPGFSNAHNLAINEETGFAYAVGTNTCSGGLHFINIQNPQSPVGAGCFSADGYTHDAQCVIYTGPDTTHQGEEICFAFNEDTVTIVNVSNKAAPFQISRTPYSGSAYTHQGWITEDQLYMLHDDELDEQSFGHNTRTRIWDISNLDAPVVIGFFDSAFASIDHNLYILGSYAYESNYRSGLQILKLDDIGSGDLTRAAYFDIYPADNNPSFNGSWSNYPYYESGVVAVSGIEQGLFIVRPILDPDFAMTVDQSDFEVCLAGSLGTTVNLDDQNGYTGTVDLTAPGLPSGTTALFSPSSVVVPGSSALALTVTTTLPGTYPFTVLADDGSIQHDRDMSLTVYSGAPGAPTLASPANGETDVVAAPTFTWNAAAEASGYLFELATDPGFSNVIDSASTAATTHVAGVALDPLTTYYWRVTAENLCGSSAASGVFSFTTRAVPPILLVDDDDDGPDVQPAWTAALDALGYAYDVWETGGADVEPALGDLAAYDVVLWFSGDRFGTQNAGPAGPSPSTEAALSTWLDGGGCFFISSQDYVWDKGLTAFMTGRLGVTTVTNDNGDYTSVTGQNVFAGLGPYVLTFPYSDFSDPITVGNGGVQAMLGNNGKVAGVSKELGAYKTSFWAFGLEALPQAGREAALEAFIDWCGLPDPPVMNPIFLPVVIREP